MTSYTRTSVFGALVVMSAVIAAPVPAAAQERISVYVHTPQAAGPVVDQTTKRRIEAANRLRDYLKRRKKDDRQSVSQNLAVRLVADDVDKWVRDNRERVLESRKQRKLSPRFQDAAFSIQTSAFSIASVSNMDAAGHHPA